MSGSPTPSQPTAVPFLDTVAPYCPACDRPFRGCGGEHADAAPQVFGCGHVVCLACAEAITVMDDTTCYVCKCDVSDGFTPDVGLAAFVETLHGDCIDSQPSLVVSSTPSTVSMSSARCSEHSQDGVVGYCPQHSRAICRKCTKGAGTCVGCTSLVWFDAMDTAAGAVFRDQLQSLRELCETGADRVSIAIPSLNSARQRLESRCESGCAFMLREAEALKASIDAHVNESIEGARTRMKDRLKRVDAQLDELQVTLAQLRAAVTMCDTTLTKLSSGRSGGEIRDVVTTALICDSVRRTAGLAKNYVYRGPPVNTMVDIIANFTQLKTQVASCIKSYACVTGSVLDHVGGPPPHEFRTDAVNGVIVTVNITDSVVPDDVVVWFKPAGVSVDSVAQLGGGVFAVQFTPNRVTVPDGRLAMSVSVCGTIIARDMALLDYANLSDEYSVEVIQSFFVGKAISTVHDVPGLTTTVLSIMKAKTGCERVQMAGLGFLRWVVQGGNLYSPPVATPDSIATICTAMSTHMSSLAVAQDGAVVLCTLVLDSVQGRKHIVQDLWAQRVLQGVKERFTVGLPQSVQGVLTRAIDVLRRS